MLNAVKKLFALSFFMATYVTTSAQVFSVSTNIGEWANFATMNIEVGMGISRHGSLHFGARINPWTFGITDQEASYEDIVSDKRKIISQNKTALSLSARIWPWFNFSGWWIRPKVQYSRYDRGGLFTPQRHEGYAVGMGIGGGYAWMFNERWNVDIGLSGWLGYQNERVFERMNSQEKKDPKGSFFILPDEIIIGIVYVF